MHDCRWKIAFFLILIMLVGLAAVRLLPLPRIERGLEAPAGGDSGEGDGLGGVGAYFPAFVGLKYHFAGEGMEFASFSRQITFAAGNLIQVEELNGTNLVRVIELAHGEIKEVWSQEEFYSGESLLDGALFDGAGAGRREQLILLQAPLQIGRSWEDARFRREIVGVDETVAVPLGTCHSVLVVKSIPRGSAQSPDGAGIPQAATYEYYAQNLGLIRRESVFTADGETYSVVSQLQRICTGSNEGG